MSLFVMDTDTLTLFARGHAGVVAQAAAHDPSELAVTIITVEEVLTGWHGQIRRAKKDDQIERAYAALQQASEFFGQIRVLPFELAAIRDFHDLRRAYRRSGANDLKIAAIVRAHAGILVTRNQRDFKDIPGLSLEDWS